MTKSRQVDGQPNGPIRDHPIGTHIPANASCPCSKEPSCGRVQPNSSTPQGPNPNIQQLTQRWYTPEGTDTGAVSISTREDGRDRRPSANPALHMHTLQEWLTNREALSLQTNEPATACKGQRESGKG